MYLNGQQIYDSDTSPWFPTGSVHRFYCALAALEGCSVNGGL